MHIVKIVIVKLFFLESANKLYLLGSLPVFTVGTDSFNLVKSIFSIIITATVFIVLFTFVILSKCKFNVKYSIVETIHLTQ